MHDSDPSHNSLKEEEKKKMSNGKYIIHKLLDFQHDTQNGFLICILRTGTLQRKLGRKVALHGRPQLVQGIGCVFRHTQDGIMNFHVKIVFGWILALGRMRDLDDLQSRQDGAEIAVGTRPGVFGIGIVVFCLPAKQRILSFGLGGPAPLNLLVYRLVDGLESDNIFQNFGIKIEYPRIGKGSLECCLRKWCIDVSGDEQILLVVLERVAAAVFVEPCFFNGGQNHVVGAHPIGSMSIMIGLCNNTGTKPKSELEKGGHYDSHFENVNMAAIVEKKK